MEGFSYQQFGDDQVDYFDLLPDPILVLILNKLFDAKSLCSCLLVSKRFASLVCEIDSISIQMNQKSPKSKKFIEDSSKSSSGSKGLFKNPIFKFIYKPISLIQQAIANKKMNSLSKNGGGLDVLKWVGNTLKNFPDVQSINLELPCHGGEIGINKNIPLLKWEAEFGIEMEKCAILGANSIIDRKEKIRSENNENETQNFSDEELKLRIIWIISCLIASSARHNLMKKMVGQCPKLRKAMISDGGKQGKLCMNEEQIEVLRNSMKISKKEENPSLKLTSESNQESDDHDESNSMNYSGYLVMKLWYVKELELPCSGKIMKGATLVMIKPEKKGNNEEKENDGLNMLKAFEGEDVFEEAAKELLKRKEKRMYRLEMNSS